MNTHTETKHTLGPWTASAPDGSYHDVIRIHADGREIPVAICPQQASPALQVLSNQTNETTEAAANARLIAAAPEMLEALDPDSLEAIADELFGTFQNSARADSLRVIAKKQRAAIAKATGGAQ